MAMFDGNVQLPKYNKTLSSKQLLDAQANIWNQTFSFINSMAVKSAVQLGIPDIIHAHGSPMSLSQLVDALPINKAKSHCIQRLMRILTHSKFFTKLGISSKEEECYWLTPSSLLLLRGKIFTLVPFVRLIVDPVFVELWHYMSKWLVCENYGSAFEEAHRKDIWEYMEHESGVGNVFHESMSCDGRFVMSILLKEYKHLFEGVELVVDVGGGVGTTAMAILDALPPGTKCVVLDLPHVVDGLEETNNLTFVGGDMFESIPQGDIVFLKWILHDWNDDNCVRILRKCKEAILEKKNNKVVGGGKVMIIDMVLHDDDIVIEEAQLLCDLAMMSYVDGKERNEKEWAKLFRDAGFSNYKINHVLGMRSIIEVYP